MAECNTKIDSTGLIEEFDPLPSDGPAKVVSDQTHALAGHLAPVLPEHDNETGIPYTLTEKMLTISSGQRGIWSGQDPDGTETKPAATLAKTTWVNLSQDGSAFAQWAGGAANYETMSPDPLPAPSSSKGFYDFTGGDLAYNIDGSASNVLLNTPYTIVIVFCNQSEDSNTEIMGQNGDGADNGNLSISIRSDGKMRYLENDGGEPGNTEVKTTPAGRGRINCLVARNSYPSAPPSSTSTIYRGMVVSTGTCRHECVYSGDRHGQLSSSDLINLGKGDNDDFLGRIYEVGMWARALSDAEVDGLLRTFEADYHGVRI